ncbi:fimbria/pilus outer membrane usher protein [Glaciimonas sp. GNP009]
MPERFVYGYKRTRESLKKISRWKIKYLLASLIACQGPALATPQQVSQLAQQQSAAELKPVQVSGQKAEQDLLLDVVVNNQKVADATLIVRTATNQILIPLEVLTNARLRLHDVVPIKRNQVSYISLDAIPGVQIEIEEATQTLNILAPPAAFVGAQFNFGDQSPLVEQPSTTGAFLNYDVNYTRGINQNNLSGVAELGIFSGGGTFTSRFVGLDLIQKSSVFRLDSQYTRDFPTQQATLVVGDSITGTSSFSRQVYFGGVQWHTKFSTTPGFQAIPLPTFNGTAAVPSVVDIYVNNILRLQQPVDTGPFAINNVPVSAGQGNVQMVVHDVLGRQQVYTQSYITSTQLLKQGSKDESYEIGAMRNNFGSRNSYYGESFSSGTLRYGISNVTTVEGHGEIMRGRQSFGFGAAAALGNIGLLSAGLAASSSERGRDTSQYLQFDRQGDRYAFTLRSQLAGSRFWQLGLDHDTLPPAEQFQAQANVSITANTNVAFGYVSQINRGQDNVRAINVGANYNLHRSGNVSVGLLKSLTDDRPISVNVVWVIPLSHQNTFQMTASGQKGSKFLSAEYQQAAPAEGGWGYRARESVFVSGGQDIGVNYVGTTGEYNASANRINGQSNLQLEARGGIALMGGHVRASRWLDQSFAIIEVPVTQPIDIYANNVKVGQTDKNGVGFVPRLIPYEKNNVYPDDAGLPLSMTLELEQKSVVPGPRSGSLLKFTARLSQSATVILVDETGTPFPNGTRVRVNGDQAEQEIALHGELFIPQIIYPATIVVLNDDAQPRCSIQIAATSHPQMLPRLGPFTCHQEAK